MIYSLKSILLPRMSPKIICNIQQQSATDLTIDLAIATIIKGFLQAKSY